MSIVGIMIAQIVPTSPFQFQIVRREFHVKR